KKLSGGHTARWHDHRIHWMGSQPPPIVRRAPSQRHAVFPTWTVELRRDTLPIVVTGTLTWVPGPNPWPWAAGALALALLTVAGAFSRAWAGALAAAVVVLITTDVV